EVVAPLAVGDQPGGGEEGAGPLAVDGDIHLVVPGAADEGDVVAAGGAPDAQLAPVVAQQHGADRQRLGGAGGAAGLVGHGEGELVGAAVGGGEAEGGVGALGEQLAGGAGDSPAEGIGVAGVGVGEAAGEFQGLAADAAGRPGDDYVGGGPI